MTERLDIFRVLNKANAKDDRFFDELTEEEVKAFQPFLVMRWMSGTHDARQILFIDAIANKYVFPLLRHKRLLWDLLVICNSGKKVKYTWYKLPAKQDPSRPNATKVVMQFYNYSSKDAVEALRLLNRDDVIEMAEYLGWQPDDIAKVKKEIKASKDDNPETKKAKKSTPVIEDLFEY